MMKKLFSIVLCFTLLLSCMPAMATVVDGDNMPSINDVEELYTIDISGSEPVLKLNGVAVAQTEGNPTLTKRGNTAIVNDSTITYNNAIAGEIPVTGNTGTNAAKLYTLPGDINTYQYEFNWTNSAVDLIGSGYSTLASALMVDMGADNKLTGDVLIKFKMCDQSWNASRTIMPLVINKYNTSYREQMGVPAFITLKDTGSEGMRIAGGQPIYFSGSNGQNGAQPVTNYAKALSRYAWHDFTVLYNTTEGKFKLWIDGVQYLNTDGTQWFVDGLNNNTNNDRYSTAEGIQDVIFATQGRSNGDGNFISAYNNMNIYFKDMAFGEYTAPDTTVKDAPVNKIAIDFDYGTDNEGNKYYERTYTTQTASTGNPAIDDTGDYVVISATNSANAEAVIVDAPAGATNAPNTGAVLKTSNITSHWGSASYGVSYGDGRTLEENMYIEFDFCNGTTTPAATNGSAGNPYPNRINPLCIDFGSSNPRASANEQILGFDENGIYVNENLVKAEPTYNKWYHVKVLYAPTADSVRVWIDGELMKDEAGNDWFNIGGYEGLTHVHLGVGRFRTKDAGTVAYFDNFEMYNADNRVDFDSPSIATDTDNDAFVFAGTARNKTDEAIVAVPVLAVYDQANGNVLKKLAIGAPVTVEPGDVESLETSASLDGLNAICSAKAFIWQTSFEAMKPFDADMFFGRSMADGVFVGRDMKTPARIAADEAAETPAE